MRAVRRCATLAIAGAFVTVATAAPGAGGKVGFRPLAPGVLTVIPAPVAPAGSGAAATDTVRHSDLLDITLGRQALKWQPLQAPAHTTFFARGFEREYARAIWNLEFAFKPPRMIDVDVPAGGGKMQRKRIWYLVYRVKNAGGRRPKIDATDSAQRTTEAFETPIRFVPQFVLESQEPLDEGEGLSSYRAYLDRVVPTALDPIRAREGGGRKLLDSAEMVAGTIAPGEERWGVATWEDVDPRIDFFSIYVRGLTNALQWRRRPGAKVVDTEPPGTAMEQALRTLRLDFWRPGDDRQEAEDEISVGFAGMFERMSLGSRLLEAVGVAKLDHAEPTEGLRSLGLEWSDLLEPADAADPARGDVGTSLLPLQVVIGKLAAMAGAEARGQAARRVFGDIGVAAFGDLSRALAAPVDEPRDAVRRAELAKLGLTPEVAEKKPLTSLAAVIRALEAERSPSARRAASDRLFGPAGRRVEWLAKRVSLARALAVLEAVDVSPDDVAAGDARTAFDAVRPAVESEEDAAKRTAILRGLFGARGPALFAAAVAVDEGIDHSWVFRYENSAAGP